MPESLDAPPSNQEVATISETFAMIAHGRRIGQNRGAWPWRTKIRGPETSPSGAWPVVIGEWRSQQSIQLAERPLGRPFVGIIEVHENERWDLASACRFSEARVPIEGRDCQGQLEEQSCVDLVRRLQPARVPPCQDTTSRFCCRRGAMSVCVKPVLVPSLDGVTRLGCLNVRVRQASQNCRCLLGRTQGRTEDKLVVAGSRAQLGMIPMICIVDHPLFVTGLLPRDQPKRPALDVPEKLRVSHGHGSKAGLSIFKD